MREERDTNRRMEGQRQIGQTESDRETWASSSLRRNTTPVPPPLTRCSAWVSNSKVGPYVSKRGIARLHCHQPNLFGGLEWEKASVSCILEDKKTRDLKEWAVERGLHDEIASKQTASS